MAGAAQEAHRELVSLLPAGRGCEPWPVPTQRPTGPGVAGLAARGQL